jgi:hypothetical protein
MMIFFGCFNFFRLRGTLSSNKWDNLLLLNPNNILRQIEQKNVSVLFVCSNDLKYAVHAAHLPFLCRLNNTKLVVLKAGSAIEMHSYFGNNNLFMFGFLNSPEIVEFSNQFAEIEPLDVSSLPRTSIKK